MLDTLLSGTAIPALEQVVKFAQARHAVLAGNIANFDTPGYRVRDLSPEKFEARLAQALRERDRGGARSEGLGAFPHRSLHEVSDDLSGVLFHDDSNGMIEEQVAAVSRNQSRHNLAMAIMSSQYRLLQTAITERV